MVMVWYGKGMVKAWLRYGQAMVQVWLWYG
jgi:hypothetical protein